MRYVKVAGAALNQTPLDWKGNRANIVAAIRAAREQGVQVLCLPELCLSGYGCEDAFHGESVAHLAMRQLIALLPETRGIAVAVGLPVIHGQNLYNAVAMLVDGKLAGLAAKKVLAGYGVYYEPRWFKAWPAGVSDTLQVQGEAVPIGDLVFDLGTDGERLRVGFEICEDAWARGQAQAGPGLEPADVLLNPSASHFAFGKYETLKTIVLEGSRLAHAAYLYANLAGNESGRLIFDGTVLIAGAGRMIAENPRFSYRDVGLVTALVDVRALRLERRRLTYPAASGDRARPAVPAALRFAEPPEAEVRTFRATQERPTPTPTSAPGAPPAMGKDEEFARAVSLGLWDYLRKSRGRGLAVSLSGGVDSATCAVLSGAMVRWGLQELGWEGFRNKLAYIADLPAPPRPGQEEAEGEGAVRALIQRLVMTVYQASENSSATTRNAARSLAEHLGSRHIEFEIGPLVQAYEQLAEKAIGRKLTWEQDDIPRQNIQARVRSPGIWLLVNLQRFLLLSTSNRSEVGVGYATMDGDTSGGLAPIAGANKTFLRAWLRTVEQRGIDGLGPIPALAAVNGQAPTAELRPSAEGQEDEKDLMPYPVLDAIEQAAIRDRMSPVEVWQTLRTANLPGGPLSARRAADCVARFFRLWSQSQWKRERLAPSFHLDDENLDPRTWCRFPILQGGYETELEELEQAVTNLPTP
jgi:NAD+ synthase (glutamine-hydrolysing)